MLKPPPKTRVAVQDPTERLTAREREILRLVMLGLTSKAVGQRLGISPGTVDNRIKSALGKLGVSERMQAARMVLAADKGVQWQDLQSLDLLMPGPVEQQGVVELSDDERSDGNSAVQDQNSVVRAQPFNVPHHYEHPADGRRAAPTATNLMLNAVLIAALTAVIVLIVFACSDALTRIVWRVALRPS